MSSSADEKKPRNWKITALLVLGLVQLFGDLTGIQAIHALGAASGASPAPKVFSSVQGLETFSSLFFIDWLDTDGTFHQRQLTPKLYSRIAGPYNRRNPYGAALAYGPVLRANPLTLPMFQSVSRYAFCGKAPLLVELGVDPKTVTRLGLRVLPKSTTKPAPGLRFSYEEQCQG